MEVRPLTVDEAHELAFPLTLAHWDEQGWGFPLDPNVELYRNLDRLGWWFAFGVFEGDKLIGYATGTVMPSPFNPAVRIYNNELIYIMPEFRHTLATAKLMAASEAHAQLLGVQFFVWHAKRGSRWDESLEHHGYTEQHVVRTKEVQRHG